jgi:hypothetical protein
MDYSKAFLVVCVTLIIVIGLNAAIYAMFARRRNEVGQIELLRRASQRARQPWHGEDEALQELSQRVKELRKDQSHKDTGSH